MLRVFYRVSVFCWYVKDIIIIRKAQEIESYKIIGVQQTT